MDQNKEELKKAPLVSILMLTYNRANYIGEAISSVLEQTYTNWELVIIDDGSTDKTAQIIASFNEPRIQYIKHQHNAGLYTRRRESIELANGQYIAVLDSDDKWAHKEKLAKQVDFLEENPEHILVGTFTKLINDRGEEIGLNEFATDDLSIRHKILTRNQFTHSAVLMKQSTVLKTDGYQNILAEDLELFLQLGALGKFANLDVIGTAHRVHKGSANDHGIKMASAVHKIIKKHRHQYPNYTLAWVKSIVRLGVAKFKNLFKTP